MIAIEDAAVIAGDLPARALALVREWVLLHQTELVEAWNRAQQLEPPGKINPLP